MAPRKAIGWALVVVGLLIIVWGLYSSYSIFTAKKAVPEIFKVEKKAVSSEEVDSKNMSQEEIQQQMEKIVEQQIGEMIPQENIYKLLNLISWSIFVAILFLGGGKIASIGIKMLRGNEARS